MPWCPWFVSLMGPVPRSEISGPRAGAGAGDVGIAAGAVKEPAALPGAPNRPGRDFVLGVGRTSLAARPTGWYAGAGRGRPAEADMGGTIRSGRSAVVVLGLLAAGVARAGGGGAGLAA